MQDLNKLAFDRIPMLLRLHDDEELQTRQPVSDRGIELVGAIWAADSRMNLCAKVIYSVSSGLECCGSTSLDSPGYRVGLSLR